MPEAIAVLTSGGDSPGMNAAVRAVTRRALDAGVAVYGVLWGYEGLIEGGESIRPLLWGDVGGIIQKGGTFLGTARSERFRTAEGRRRAVVNLLERAVDGLVVIGGDGSLSGAHVLSTEWPAHLEAIRKDRPDLASAADRHPALNVIGLPGSIDNDLYGTDMSIGADTALNHIVRTLDDLASTAASHQRTFVVETMGRHCGYLALMGALAGGASWVLIPEEELDPRWHQKMVNAIQNARKTGRAHQMVVVAEGARHADGLPIRTEEVRDILARRLGVEVRVTVLGHVQRGGAPTAFDRTLATRLGTAAADALIGSPGVLHQHMLGLKKNVVVATPLPEVVQKSQAVGQEIEKGDYARALELRGDSFRNTLTLVKTLTRIAPTEERRENGAVAILTGGADAPGMNAAVSVAARCLMNAGIPVYGVRDAFRGLVEGDMEELRWNELLGWMSRPSSEIGTARRELTDEDLPRMAEHLAAKNIRGLIVVGGLGTYCDIGSLSERREDFKALDIPMILIPATIDNNLPGTDFTIGSDTALNNIVEAVDRLRHTAGASRRAFIVEVMGKNCGFLALMGALASGSEKAYLPETGVTLAELSRDVEMLRASFASGKRMVIALRNEECSRYYTTDFIRRLLEAESSDEFDVRMAILGHVQRGGAPTAFDRILASRLGAACAQVMLSALASGEAEVTVMGFRGHGVGARKLAEALTEMDLEAQRPAREWFMELRGVMETLAKYGPGV